MFDRFIAAFVNEKASMLAEENGAVVGQNSALDGLLENYKNNLTALEKAKADENTTAEDLARLENAVAKSIVEYEAACKGTNVNVEDIGDGSYRVTYTNESGQTITEFYKKGATTEDGNVHVYMAAASYVVKDETGNITGTIDHGIVTEENGTQYIVVKDLDGNAQSRQEVLSISKDENGDNDYGKKKK